MKVHHIGYLVDNIENAVNDFEKLGFTRIGELKEDVLRGIYVLFLANGAVTVELIQPSGRMSPVYGLRKRYRNSPYHICYETQDLRNEIIKMTNGENARGEYLLIDPPESACAIPGCPKVAFLANRYIGMIELIEIKEGS